MNFGYLIFASSHESNDYLKMAYALAVSIKNTQKEGWNNVALVTNSTEEVDKLNSPWVFDKVIHWNRGEFWDCRSYMYDVTPWEHTICLDADMLFTKDISHVVEYLVKEHDIYLPCDAYTYRGNKITDDYCRKTFVKNNLPNVYTMFSYFKKTKNNDQFFHLIKIITEYKKEFKNSYLTEYKPTILGTDEIFALTSKILDYCITLPTNIVQIAHLKGEIQDWHSPSEKITNRIGIYLTKDQKIKVGTYLQNAIVHYVEKDLMSNEYVSILEEKLWKNDV